MDDVSSRKAVLVCLIVTARGVSFQLCTASSALEVLEAGLALQRLCSSILSRVRVVSSNRGWQCAHRLELRLGLLASALLGLFTLVSGFGAVSTSHCGGVWFARGARVEYAVFESSLFL